MKIALYGILAIVVSIGLAPNAFSHEPDFESKTSEDVLKLCNFFYEEYTMIGVENFNDHHKLYLHAKICPILFEHIAWQSNHPQKDLVLIAEIEKKLNENSSYLKERHVAGLSDIPKEFQNKATLWINGEINDMEFLEAIEEMSNSKMNSKKEMKYERMCNDTKSCLKENDYFEYISTNIHGEKTFIRLQVIEKTSNETTLEIKTESQSKTETKRIGFDKNNQLNEKINGMSIDRLVYTIPYQTNQVIEDDFLVTDDSSFVIGDYKREGLLAGNQEGKEITIDKKTGAVLSMKFNENVDPESYGMVLSGTNIFENVVFVESNHTDLPNWFKDNTKWYLDELISEKEYMNGIKFLVESK